jgi:hypothetical protein
MTSCLPAEGRMRKKGRSGVGGARRPQDREDASCSRQGGSTSPFYAAFVVLPSIGCSSRAADPRKRLTIPEIQSEIGIHRSSGKIGGTSDSASSKFLAPARDRQPQTEISRFVPPPPRGCELKAVCRRWASRVQRRILTLARLCPTPREVASAPRDIKRTVLEILRMKMLSKTSAWRR